MANRPITADKWAALRASLPQHGAAPPPEPKTIEEIVADHAARPLQVSAVLKADIAKRNAKLLRELAEADANPG